MKKYFVALMIFIAVPISAQIDLTAGMGISFFNNGALKDYVNSNFPSSDNLGTFNSEFEIYLESDYTVSPNFQIGLEYIYTIFSYNAQFVGTGQYELAYNAHKPSLLAYYVIPGNGYKFKFGGGLGIRYVDLTEDIYQTTDYSSLGFGMLLRAQGLTLLSDNLYANIGATARYDFSGEPESGKGTKIYDNGAQENLSLNSISFSIDIGLSYVF